MFQENNPAMDELHDIDELQDNYPEDFEQGDDGSDPFADNPYENPALDHRSFTVVTASLHPNPDNPKGLEQSRMRFYRNAGPLYGLSGNRSCAR